MKRTAIKILWLAVVILIGARAEAGEARKPSVLVVHATLYSADIQAKLTSSKVFDKVDLFNANTGTPTLSTLKSYDAVLITSDLLFADATTLGNNLADYVDAGDEHGGSSRMSTKQAWCDWSSTSSARSGVSRASSI